MLLLFAGVASCRRQKLFSLRSIVPGNWSTSSNDEFHVMYFVPYQGHFQALLNDMALDMYVLSRSSVRVEYIKYNFTMELENVDDVHPHGYATLTDFLSVDVNFMSRNALTISIINTKEGMIKTWGVIRPHLTEISLVDAVKVVGFFIGLVYVMQWACKMCCKL